jgi:hypothetical protein
MECPNPLKCTTLLLTKSISFDCLQHLNLYFPITPILKVYKKDSNEFNSFKELLAKDVTYNVI